MEESVYYQPDVTQYGATENGNNKMLVDNVVRAELILQQLQQYKKQYFTILDNYLKAHNKAYLVALSVQPMECCFDRAVLIPSSALDVPYNFANFAAFKNASKYQEDAKRYFKLEEIRLKLLLELAIVKEKIDCCEQRLAKIQNNLETNYSKNDFYKEKYSDFKLTQSQAVKKVITLKNCFINETVRMRYFNHIPSQNQVSEQFLRLNKIKKDYFLKCSDHETVKFI